MMRYIHFLFSALLIICSLQLPAEAKKYVMNITPAQEINTKNGAIAKGDIINFTTINDVYVDNQLFIAKNTPVSATVQFVEPDAWVGETPLLVLNYFETKDITGDPVVIEYSLEIKGKYGLSKTHEYVKYYAKSIIFCANLELKPDDVVFNILFDKD